MSGSWDLEAASSRATNPPNVTTNAPQPLDLHPIIATLREQELGKTALSLAIPIAVATLFQRSAIQLGSGLHVIQILVAMGCVGIWNGIMLKKPYPRAASLVEQAGISLVFLAFNVLLAAVIPKGFVWFPVLCFGFFVLPFAMAALPRQADA